MRILIAVGKDLWNFVRFELVGAPSKIQPASLTLPLGLPAPLPKLGLPDSHHNFDKSVINKAPSADTANSSLFAISIKEAPVYSDPVQGFDNVLAYLPYGTEVTVTNRSGRWSAIRWLDSLAWVMSDSVDYTRSVNPVFLVGKVYDNPELETVHRLRLCIRDSFHAGVNQLPLLGVEYVTYMLWKKGITIPWPKTYARVAGSWQRKLRGVPGIFIDVKPHTGSIMEYVIDEVGYLAYVSAVSPDLELSVSAVGLTNEAQYTENKLSLEVWRELRPVFISVL